MFKTRQPGATPSSGPADALKSARVPPRQSGVPSIVSAEMTVHGDLRSAGDLQVDGNVVGDIEVGKIVISSGGSVSGNISAKDVRICGTMTGTIRGAMVTLTATARMTGDIFHELLAIETGAQLDGQARRLASDVALPAPRPHEAPGYPNGNGHDQPAHDTQHNQHDHHPGH